MDESERDDLANKSWKIEEYHIGIKQLCDVEKCQARKNESQRAHVMLSLRAFLRLEIQRIKNAVLHQLDPKIIYPHYDFKHLTEKYFEIGMKLDDFLIQLVKY